MFRRELASCPKMTASAKNVLGFFKMFCELCSGQRATVTSGYDGHSDAYSSTSQHGTTQPPVHSDTFDFTQSELAHSHNEQTLCWVRCIGKLYSRCRYRC